jgi:hypothetical protein
MLPPPPPPPPKKQQQTKEGTLVTRTSTGEPATGSRSVILLKSQLVEYVPKHCLEKRIEPSQTRFPSQQQIIPVPGGRIGTNNNSNVNDRTGLVEYSETDNDDGMSATDTSYYSTDLDGPLRSLEEERERRRQKIARQQQQQQQQHNQRSYVAMTPQIIPGAGNQSPITTWGTVDATPLVLSGQETSSNQQQQQNGETGLSSSSFQLAGENERDTAARKAEANIALRSKRAKQASSTSSMKSAVKNTRTGTTKSSSSSLTPAAMSLLEKTKRVPSRSRDAFGSALRMSYTPQRRSSSSSSSNQLLSSSRQHRGTTTTTTTSQPRRKRDHAYNATPQL